MKQDPPEGSFAALFESQAAPEKIRRKAPRIGDTLEAKVVQVGRDTVFVELDGKRQAHMEASELRADDGTMTVAVGDTIRASVVAIDPGTGDVRLARSIGKPGSVAAIEQARESGVAVEGKVTKLNKGGLEIDLGGARAFCPMSQIDNTFVQDASIFVGKSLRFVVTEVKDGGKSVTVSRRALLARESQETQARMLQTIVAGAVLTGSVTGIREFGAFVDLGGIDGLIPASEIAHDRGTKVEDALKIGDVVTVQVREVKEVPPKRPGDSTKKITLSLKALAKDPWDDIDAVVTAGQVARGTVTRVVEFGAFVKVAPGVEGLLHISELGGNSRALSAGQALSVVVGSVDKEKRKISLVPAPDGLDVGAKVSNVKVAVGAIVQGTVDRIENYGIFLQIEGTSGKSGRGLVPSAELGVPRGTDMRKTFPVGTKLSAKVLETGDGRMRLSLRAVKDDEERAQYEGFASSSGAGKMGTLGDLLKNRKK